MREKSVNAGEIKQKSLVDQIRENPKELFEFEVAIKSMELAVLFQKARDSKPEIDYETVAGILGVPVSRVQDVIEEDVFVTLSFVGVVRYFKAYGYELKLDISPNS